MAINYPSYKQIAERIRADITANLPDVDPTIYGSIVRVLGDSFAGRIFDMVQLLKQQFKQVFPQTAEGDFLELWAEYEGINRIASTVSSGDITVTGVATTSVPISTQWQTANGNTYTSLAGATLASQSFTVASITRSGTTATVTTDADHTIATNTTVTIAGANESDYNGDFVATATGTNTFEYTVSGSPSSPATGTITASYIGASIEVQSDDTGADLNLDSGASLTLVTPITDVDDTGYVQFLGLTGGADDETDSALLVRVLQSRSNPVANFNSAKIEKVALEVAGVTRVWVDRITPAVGQVTITFVRDDDGTGTAIIPSGAEITEVKDDIVAILPANSDEDDVIVQAPTALTTNYTFTAISPDTTTMRDAIEASLQAFYRDEVDYATDITEDKYRSAIINTIDPDTGDTLTSFTLSAPSGDITIASTEIGVLGTVSF